MTKEKIKAMFVFEIIGRPPEHIKETMSQLVDKVGELEGVEISNKKIHEPKPIEKGDVKNFFTTFSEVEILGQDLNVILNVVFFAMPSHVEIIEPEELRFKNFDLSNLLSALTVKLHRYDEIAKASIIENKMLANKVKELEKGRPEIKIEDVEKKEEGVKDENEDDEKKEDGKNQKNNGPSHLERRGL